MNTNLMKILAIDPGNMQSAYVLLDGTKVEKFGILPNQDLLDMFGEFPCCPMAIEMVESFGMAVGKEVFETVFWTGRFYQEWEGRFYMARKGAVHRVYRKEVKMHLCHSMRAKDGNIRQALIDKLGPQGTKKAKGPTYGISKDCWSALAVGITFIETGGLNRAGDVAKAVVR